MATLRHAVGTLRRIADWGARVCIAEQGSSNLRVKVNPNTVQ